MVKQQLEGWLFDVDDLGPEVALWVYTSDRRLLRLTDAFNLPLYVAGERARLKALASELERRGIIASVRWAERREIWSGANIEVLMLPVADSSVLPKLRRLAAERDREFTFYNCDIPAAQYYLYLKKLFPLCQLACEVDEAGRVLAMQATETDEIDEGLDYRLPDLRIVTMRGERMQPRSDKSRIVLECAGSATSVRFADGAQAIDSFNAFISEHDPDVILSERGDSLLFPALLRLGKREKRELLLDRDRVVTKRKIITEGRTYFSYGRVIYQGPSYPLFGRWHLDAGDSFIHRETRLDGLAELARLAKIPMQRLARTTPGSAMTSMEMDRAIAEEILVPWHKSEPESYKTALDLLVIDKGGLVFQPRPGAFERVAEIDFASMYPSIIVEHNISPETVLCGCCKNAAVPEAGYDICEKRRGLIPRTLAPLLERRRGYKRRMRTAASEREREMYDARQRAIKWMLVSCFGYLGYKNARFGRIEAHEAVTAFGREKLLKAKEIAEARGYRLLHALTDSLWLKREEMTESDIRMLCEEIKRATRIEISLEGIYNWIVFLPSKVKAERPVACRYYGVFADGRIKLRGLACRRSDTPQFIKDAQLELLAILSEAKTLAERAPLIGRATALLEARKGELERGAVASERLLVKRTLTKEVDDYAVETRTAVAARQLLDRGVEVHPGERVGYLITDARAADRSQRVRAEGGSEHIVYDRTEYVKLLEAAFAEVVAYVQVEDPPPSQATASTGGPTAAEIRDVFICHASEDKSAVVAPLVGALAAARISCWYDQAEIRWGDSVTGKVNEGLSISRYVIVVLSPAFLGKHWPEREMNAALNLEATTGEVKVLPLIVGSQDEVCNVLRRFPLLNDKLHLVWRGELNPIVTALEARLRRCR